MVEVLSKPPPVYDSVLCASFVRNGDCIDNGWSGGPLVYNNTLVGVTTWALDVAKIGTPNGFQRIHLFVDWIDEVLARGNN